MKVIMIEYFLPTNTYSIELCNELSKYCDLTLICKDNYRVEEDKNYKILPILHSKASNKVDGFIGYLNDLIKIKNIVKRERPNVLHLQGIVHLKLETLFYKSIKKYADIICYTVHNVLSHETKRSESKNLKSFYNICDIFCVHNNYSKELFKSKNNIEKNIYVIPHGCYDQYKNKDKLKHNEDKIVFLLFGLIRKYKGIDILLEAISKLPREVLDNSRFVIAGNQRAKYDKFDYIGYAKKLGIYEYIDFKIRFIRDEEVEELFSNSDCCLFPYRNVYGSGALLMAYTFEKPIIASNIPTFIEESMEGETGILFKSENPEDLKDAIIEFYNLTIGEKLKLTNRIKKVKEDKYNWKHSALIMSKSYKKNLK